MKVALLQVAMSDEESKAQRVERVARQIEEPQTREADVRGKLFRYRIAAIIEYRPAKGHGDYFTAIDHVYLDSIEKHKAAREELHLKRQALPPP
jgi:hypothetical protein